jgi:hypothetical protein
MKSGWHFGSRGRRPSKQIARIVRHKLEYTARPTSLPFARRTLRL